MTERGLLVALAALGVVIAAAKLGQTLESVFDRITCAHHQVCYKEAP